MWSNNMRKSKALKFLGRSAWLVTSTLFLLALMLQNSRPVIAAVEPVGGEILIADLNGSINPATDDFLKTTIKRATQEKARMLIVRLNTPGGLVTSMQTMVQSLLDAPLPVVIYVTPSGASATSAGVFITMAGHLAVMTPGTTIGAAHPVVLAGKEMQGDMRAKVENFAVSLMKAIAEQRGRNAVWGEKSVRESVSITDREAEKEKVVDFLAGDLDELLAKAEGRVVKVRGVDTVLSGLKTAPRVPVKMSFKQTVINILSDPNVAILLGLGAMLGLGIEFYHPGAMFPGVIGLICLVLSLTSAQVLPINYGGVALMLLSAVFFVVELFMPTFGLFGIAGIVCLVLGAIYLIDADLLWGAEGYAVNHTMIGTIAGLVGFALFCVTLLAISSRKRRVVSGQQGLVGAIGIVKSEFLAGGDGRIVGRIQIGAEYWNARIAAEGGVPAVNSRVKVLALEPGMVAVVEAIE